MTSDEAREVFSEAVEGALDAQHTADFEAALARDSDLEAEWRAFRTMFQGTRALGRKHEDAAAPDLLPKVQSTLRSRSRGRFYRDRFAERAGQRTGELLLATTAVVLLLLGAWLLWSGGP